MWEAWLLLRQGQPKPPALFNSVAATIFFGLICICVPDWLVGVASGHMYDQFTSFSFISVDSSLSDGINSVFLIFLF